MASSLILVVKLIFTHSSFVHIISSIHLNKWQDLCLLKYMDCVAYLQPLLHAKASCRLQYLFSRIRIAHAVGPIHMILLLISIPQQSHILSQGSFSLPQLYRLVWVEQSVWNIGHTNQCLFGIKPQNKIFSKVFVKSV